MDHRNALTPLSGREIQLHDEDRSNILNLARMTLQPPRLSPDEEVIRLRGRRSFELPQSPISISRFNLSPMKKVKSPAKVLQFRSPRKRLQMDDCSTKPQCSPSKSAKRVRLLNMFRDEAEPTVALHSLNKNQLVTLLTRAIVDVDGVRSQIRGQIPAPDLHRMEIKLQQRLKIVHSCSGGKQQLSPSVSFKKMHPALDLFKTKLSNHVEALIKGNQWSTGVEYVLVAWPYVRQLPEWRDNVQNRTRLQCFKMLASLLATCLQACTNLTDSHKQVLARRLNAMKPDFPQIILPLAGVLNLS